MASVTSSSAFSRYKDKGILNLLSSQACVPHHHQRPAALMELVASYVASCVANPASLALGHMTTWRENAGTLPGKAARVNGICREWISIS